MGETDWVAEIMKYWVMLVCVVLLGCDGGLDKVPAWRVGLVTPSLYPAGSRSVYGVNDAVGWTSMVHPFANPVGFVDFESVRRSWPDYQGYGLPLGLSVETNAQVRPVHRLPDVMVVEWISYATKRVFTTRFRLSKGLKQQMNQRRRWRFNRHSALRDCYLRDVVFGLLPDGQARVWLHGCGYFRYVATVAAVGVSTLKGGAFTADGVLPEWLLRRKAAFGAPAILPVASQKIMRVVPWRHQGYFEGQQPDYSGVPGDGSVAP